MNGRERGKLLREEIWASYAAKAQDRRPNRLRPSELGHECTRYLWYRFRWADEFEAFEPRLLRLFDTGHSQEDRMVADLRRVGAEVHARDPDNPAEQISVTILEGHSKGYLDGIGGGIPHAKAEWALVECKTHSDKSFRQLETDGVAIAKPQHYAQMQLYMREQQLDEGLYIAVNKNNDDVYCEFIDPDKRYTDSLMHKAETIVYRGRAPGKINNNPTFFKCKMCSAAATCHGGKLPSRSCRTCQFSQPTRAGGNAEWQCFQHEKTLTLDEQRAGCEMHRYNPDLVAGKEIEEIATDDKLIYVYQLADGEIWEDAGPIGDKQLTSA